MKLKDYLNSPQKISRMQVRYEGKDIVFHVREMTAGDRESMAEIHYYLMNAKRKTDSNQQFITDGEGVKMMYQLRSRVCAISLCDEDGNKLFESVEDFNNSVSTTLCDLIYEAIQERAVDDPEGNSETLPV